MIHVVMAIPAAWQATPAPAWIAHLVALAIALDAT